MSAEFRSASSTKQIEALSKIASEIWNEYWPAIIGQEQTDYMVDKFQSKEAIQHDIAENDYEYWYVTSKLEDGRDYVVGYTGGHVDPETNRFFISKIYLFEYERGKGFASDIIKFYEDLCEQRGLGAMYLTVNKNNDLAINAYNAKGFEIIDSVETDIGSGFIMDDYIMEKKLI